VGSSVFPSGPNSNPSLSVAALSLRSADLLA
jgi:choline dehydrogenase-like flavoprotein